MTGMREASDMAGFFVLIVTVQKHLLEVMAVNLEIDRQGSSCLSRSRRSSWPIRNVARLVRFSNAISTFPCFYAGSFALDGFRKKN